MSNCGCGGGGDGDLYVSVQGACLKGDVKHLRKQDLGYSACLILHSAAVAAAGQLLWQRGSCLWHQSSSPLHH